MANHKSALKRARQNVNRRTRNRAAKTRVKNVIREVRLAIDGSDKTTAAKTLIAAQSVVDDTASKGIIHKNTAARKISRLSKQINTLK